MDIHADDDDNFLDDIIDLMEPVNAYGSIFSSDVFLKTYKEVSIMLLIHASHYGSGGRLVSTSVDFYDNTIYFDVSYNV